MQASDEEIIAQIRKVQSELHPALPPDIRLEADDATAAQIRIRLLRARLEFSTQQEQIPLPLVRLLALLAELAGHADELSVLLDAYTAAVLSPAENAAAHHPVPGRDNLLEAMRHTLLTGEVHSLRSLLEQQRLALILETAVPAPEAPSGEANA